MKVSDMITKDECRSWKPNDRIVIVAPTGAGKTHFVLNTLLEIAIERNQTILYLCNRTLVMEQVWVNAKEKGLEFEYIDGLLYSNNIIITTYQNIESKGGFMYAENDYRQEINFYYCVCDEAHYFVHDSVFNVNTNTIPDIIKNYMKKIIIYMTATDEPFRMQNSSNNIKYIFDNFDVKYNNCKRTLKHILENYEYDEQYNAWVNKNFNLHNYNPRYVKSLKDICEIPFSQKIRSCLKEFSHYNTLYGYSKWKVFDKIKPDYSQYDVYYYNKINELIELINQTPNDKWLIFSMNKDEGEELAENINKRIEKDTAIFLDSKFVHSNDKNVLKNDKLLKRKNIYNEIRDNNKFSCRVLISTTVLDNGVSIHDSDLKHIVLPSHNKTEFLQMIGRKRLADNETVKLYIKNHTYKEIINEQHSIIRRLNYISSFIGLNDINFTDIGVDGNNLYMNGSYNNQYPEQNIDIILNYANKKYKTMFINSKLKYSSGVANDSDNSSKRLRDLDVNKLFVYNMLCNLCEIAEISEYRINNHKETPQYKYPVLFTQLSWLNKDYDPTHWVDYERRELKTKEIIDVLKEDSQKGYFIEDKKKYISILTDAIVQSSMSLTNMKKDVGVAAFNNILKKIGLNFKMDKKQFMKNGERKYRYSIKIVEN